MDKILQKLRVIESDVVPKEGATITAESTSLRIVHTCGCVLVEHFAPGQPLTQRLREDNPERYGTLMANRKYHIELCDQHRKLIK